MREAGEQKKYVLAMYDIRGKQEFIFKTNRIKEIVGASKLIEDVFDDYLYKLFDTDRKEERAKESEGKGTCRGIFHDNDEAFSEEGFKQHLKEGYIGEVVYKGGGNFLLLMKDRETFQEVTYAFTTKVKKEVGTLRILGVCVEIDDFSNFPGDRNRLYKEHARLEGGESNVILWPSLPIVQVDRRTSLPLTETWKDKWGPAPDTGRKVSKDVAKKYEKYIEEYKTNENGEKILDNMVEKKGEDSLLAIVYIDGNNMGQQVQDLLVEEKTYGECVRKLRNFSNEIQKNYVDDPRQKIKEKLEEKETKDRKRHRFVVYAGDEINFICNAHDAFDLAATYLNSLPDDCSACAGITIFHSHAPYADAYRIAEECCENAKKTMKKKENEEKLANASLIDFHYCQGAIGSSLESIREQEVGMLTSKPWLVKKEEGFVTLEHIEAMRRFLNLIGHSNVKGLLEPAMRGAKELELELARIKSAQKENEREKIFGIYEGIGLNEEQKRCLVYDMVTVYDLWFKTKEDKEQTDGEK